MSLDDHESHYRFPLTDSDKTLAESLVTVLKAGTEQEAVMAFHRFIYPVLSFQSSRTIEVEEYTKWSESSECLFAISALREDGGFKPAHDVTQMFAQTTYHIRGAILFEGYRIKEDFGNDLVK